jgi:hypothetical protein
MRTTHLGVSKKKNLILYPICFMKNNFFCICLSLEKLVKRKCFSVKEKFGLVFRKVFFFYFGRKTLSKSCEKFRNVMLFADYIKYGPQTFDCYLFFFNFFFNFIH